MRRVLVAAVLGIVCGLALVPPWGWQLAALIGWDVGAVVFLTSTWFLIARADGVRTEHLATREDQTREAAALLLLGASLASLLAILFTLSAAGRETGNQRLLLIVGALVTVVLSWAVLNTVFTLRYADLFYLVPGGVDFGELDPDDRPDFRDFAYVAFTIGMCYQVSDSTVRNRRIRRTVLLHSVLSYLFGVVIVATAINLVAGLID
jgi:uncharacterized membrane protein